MRDRPGDQEVQRRAAALLEHDLEHLVERMAADEERQRLVLVRRPGEQLVEEEDGGCGRDRRDPEREPTRGQPRPRDRPLAGAETGCLCGLAHRRRQSAWLHSFAMPIYEYRCPDGHTFEVFQRMSDAPVEACEVCGKSPVEKVLYPVSVHFKGSGFYSTDYGRGSGKKRDASNGRRRRLRHVREEVRLGREEGRARRRLAGTLAARERVPARAAARLEPATASRNGFRSQPKRTSVSKTASPRKPPSSAPTTPTASVPKQPIDCRPGVSARATAPASSPKKIQPMIPTRRP